MPTTILEMTEDEVQEALNGNEELFNQLIHRNRRRLMVVLQRHGTSANDIEDCVQHACMRLWEYKGKVQPYNSAVFSWICTTALNRAKTLHRKTKREELIGDAAKLDNMVEPVEDMRPDENRIPNLHAAITKLQEPYRSIILMQLAGSSYENMAEHFGCPIGTIMSRRSRAVEILGREMKKVNFKKKIS